MKKLGVLIVTTMLLYACSEQRVYDDYVDFKDRSWLINQKPEFEFNITDNSIPYNLYCNVRNATTYPYSRIFIMYYLQDTAGNVLEKKLLNEYLFEAKTGKPLGNSGLGDLYDHQFAILKNHKFAQPGAYRMRFEQFMRADTLEGVLSVGLGVEKVVKAE